MKLAKRFTGRTEIAAFNNSYHGSTQGSLSIMGSEYWRNAFRPLLPGILHLTFNSFESLEYITEKTACVIAETVQAEAGVIVPGKKWMQALRKKCDDTGPCWYSMKFNAALAEMERCGLLSNLILSRNICFLEKRLVAECH